MLLSNSIIWSWWMDYTHSFGVLYIPPDYIHRVVCSFKSPIRITRLCECRTHLIQIFWTLLGLRNSKLECNAHTLCVCSSKFFSIQKNLNELNNSIDQLLNKNNRSRNCNSKSILYSLLFSCTTDIVLLLTLYY